VQTVSDDVLGAPLTYLGTVSLWIPTYAEAGTWELSATITDVCGNKATWSNGQLVSASFASSFVSAA
jgi:hypothetical protein